MNGFSRTALRVLYWTAPPVVLGLILTRINFGELRTILASADPLWLGLGLASFPLAVAVGGLRWRYSLSVTSDGSPPAFGFALKHHWIGMSLGYFAPGSIGFDVYRAAIAGRESGLKQAATAVVLEKLTALAVALGLIILLFPAAARHVPDEDQTTLALVRSTAAVSLGLIGVLAVTGIAFLRAALHQRLWHWLTLRVTQPLARKSTALSSHQGPTTDTQASTQPLQRGERRQRLLILLGLSLVIQLISTLGNQTFFLAIGLKVPFLVHFFLTPVFYFLFLLPISFGSLGIREGAYVFFYGLFGVSTERALAVSFLSLTSVLLSQALGGLLIWWDRSGSCPPQPTPEEASLLLSKQTLQPFPADRSAA